MLTAFSAGLHRPEGTLVGDAAQLHLASLRSQAPLQAADIELRRIELALSSGDAEGAHRRAKALLESGGKDGVPEHPSDILARIHFALGLAAARLGRLASSEKHLAACEAAIERTPFYRSSEPCLLPCLLNRGLVLLRLGRCKPAVACLQRATNLVDGLLSSGRLPLSATLVQHELRSRVLLALGAALLGGGESLAAEVAYRGGLEAAEKAEEQRAQLDRQQRERAPSLYGAEASGGEGGVTSCNYWGSYNSGTSSSGGGGGGGGGDGGGSSSSDGKMKPSIMRRPQPARMSLASLLQARGEHGEALKLLLVQSKALKLAHARGECSAAERAYTSGRLAISGFAAARETTAMNALREAASLRLGMSSYHADEWVSKAEALPLANAALHRGKPVQKGGGAAVPKVEVQRREEAVNAAAAVRQATALRTVR